MDFQEMTIAQLRRVAAERGVTIPRNAKKAEIVAALESSPIEVSASVVDDEIMAVKPFEIDMTKVTDDIGALTAAIDQAMEVYGDVKADQETIEQMSAGDLRICEDQLADAVKVANEARLQLGRDYKVPLNAANERYKELMGPVEELMGAYAERRKELRYMGLQNTYISVCEDNGFPTLPSVVTFERLLADHPKWMARNTNSAKMAEQVEDEALRIIGDWHTLRSQQASMRYYAEAEAEFFRTLDVGRAIEFNNRRDEEQRRLAALETERQANELARRDAEARIFAQQQAQEAAQMFAPEPEQAPREYAQGGVVDGPGIAQPSTYRYVLDITAPQALPALKELFASVGIHGKVAQVVPGSANVVDLIRSGALAQCNVTSITRGGGYEHRAG